MNLISFALSVFFSLGMIPKSDSSREYLPLADEGAAIASIAEGPITDERRAPEITRFWAYSHPKNYFDICGKATTDCVVVEFYKMNAAATDWILVSDKEIQVSDDGTWSTIHTALPGYYMVRVYNSDDHPTGPYSTRDAIMP